MEDSSVQAPWAAWTAPLVNLKNLKRRNGFPVRLDERAVEIVPQMRQGHVSRYTFPGQA